MPARTIAELVSLTGVPPATVHYYLRQGLLPKPRQAAPTRDRAIVQVAVARPVDYSEAPRQPGDRWRGCERDQRGDEKRP